MHQPLSQTDIRNIHIAALDDQSTVGFKESTEMVRALTLEAGSSEDVDVRLLFPCTLVENVIAGAARDYVLHGRTPEQDIEVHDGHLHFATDGAVVKMRLEVEVIGQSVCAEVVPEC